MKRWQTGILTLILIASGLQYATAQDREWPRTVSLENGLVTIYQPQLDEMIDNTIRYRAAIAFREDANAEPVFGAGWFESSVEIDKQKRTVHPIGFTVTETRFPAEMKDIKAELSEGLAKQSSGWDLDFTLDELESSLQSTQTEDSAAEKLNTEPPEIIYRDNPALLISMDGEPVLREIEDSNYQAVINTPYPLIYNNNRFYLNAAKDVWYSAGQATGPYVFDSSPPEDIAGMVKDDASESTTEQTTPVTITASNAPEVIVSTKPAELIVTEGPAAFVPLVDDLLVLQNSENDVFMHLSSQEYYIVLAGRWYHASSLNGPWSFQQADKLPVAFASIPKDSDQADSRVYVAGTDEAREAVLDSQVPQTAAVKRGQADVEVEYDGEPVYAPVAGTDLVYIQNTGSTVLKSGGLFYLVENGVWYVSASPNGPWQVSDHRPQQVDTILPTSPVYNSKYVHVYESTPNVVYVGYTPGYTGSYVYHNTIFYGTGWNYRPWVSPYYYYPRHSTWGFNVAYNSWSGWSFGLSWAWGPFSVGYYSGGYWHHHHHWHHRHYGHWGPRGYRPRPGHHYRGGGRYAHNGNRHNNPRNGYAGNDRNGRGDRDRSGRSDRGAGPADMEQRSDNLYRDRSQRGRIANTRDRQTRDTENRIRSTRRANALTSDDMRQKNYNVAKKGERNRITPVSTSDLRKKAKTRDINSIDIRRDTLLADNSSSNARSGRNSNQNPTMSRRELMAKRPEKRDKAAKNTRRKNPSQNSLKRNSRASGKGSAKQSTRPVSSYSPIKTGRTSNTSQPPRRISTSSNAGKKPTARKGNSSQNRQSPQPRELNMQSSKQNVARKSTEPGRPPSNTHNRSTRQSQKSNGSKNRQRTQPVASTRQATSVRKQPAMTKTPHTSARSKAAPGKSASKGSGSKSAAKNSSANRSKVKRSGGSRNRN